MSVDPFTLAMSPTDRQAVLNIAADVLKAAQPASVATVSFRRGPNVYMARAEWRWPGIVRVTMKYTGQVLALSKPGHPYVLAD